MHKCEESQPPSKTIADLPNEILLTIFSYLQTSDVKYCIPKVSTEWYLLSKDKKLWRNLTFKTTSKATKVFGKGSWFSTLRFLNTTPELQNITVSQGHTEEEVLEILTALNDFCPNIRHITFEYDLSKSATLMDDLSNLTENLESMKVRLTYASTQALVFDLLSELKKLKTVVLFGAAPEPSWFDSFLKMSRNLQHLNVERVNFSKENFMIISKEKEKLLSLGIVADKLDGECLGIINSFPKLTNLTVTDANASAEKLYEIGRLNYLTRLQLQEATTSPVLTSATLTKFFQEGSFPHLKELKLQKSRLNDEGAAEIRRNCPNLRYLEIMTYPRSLSCMSEKALLHFLHCEKLHHFEILFDNSEERDWVYRRMRYLRHECEIDEVCPLGLEGMLDSWDEIHIPID